MSKHADPKPLIEALLAAYVDPDVSCRGFKRRAGSRTFKRRSGEAQQELLFDYDAYPAYAPGADAHLLPTVRVSLPRVSEVAIRMVGGNAVLLGGAADLVIAQPFDTLVVGKASPRWLIASDTVASVGANLLTFIDRWVVPFVDEYNSVDGLIGGYERGDTRLLFQQHTFVFIAAAYAARGELKLAQDVLDRKLGTAGLRKRFAPVFEYLETNLRSTARD